MTRQYTEAKNDFPLKNVYFCNCVEGILSVPMCTLDHHYTLFVWKHFYCPNIKHQSHKDVSLSRLHFHHGM